MAKQIDKKWIADGAIDGSKIKLLEGQSLVIEVAGQPVELLKLNENGNASLPQGEVPSTEAVNQAIASEVTALSQEIAQDLQAVESGLAQEILDRQSAITTVEQSVAAETLARETAITSVEQSVQSAQTDISGLETGLAQEILDRQSGDASTLSSAQAYADQKVADLVNSAPAVLDTLKELSDALGGDANFATTVAGQIGAVDDKVDQEILDRQSGDTSTLNSAKAYTDAQIAAIPPVDLSQYYTKSEVDALQSGLSSDLSDLDAYAQDIRVDVDNLDAYAQDIRVDLDAEVISRQSGDSATLESAKDYTDAQIAAIPPVDLSNYYNKSEIDGKESALDSKIEIEKVRIDAILSASEADKDSFAEIVALINSVDTTNDQAFAGYVASNNAAVALKADKTYVDTRDALKVSKSGDSMSGKLTLNAGLDVTGRIEINDVADGTTFVFEPSLASFEVQNNTILPGYVSVIQPGQIVASLLNEEGTESLGNTSVEPGLINLWGSGLNPAVATEPQHAVNKQYVDQAIAAIPPVDLSSLESADVAFDSRISALENAPDAVIFEEDKEFIVDGINVNSTYVDLPHLAKAVLKVGVNRLNAYKTRDYTVSEVGGVTRITWNNDLASGGLSEIAGGDFIYVTYAR